MLERDDLLQYMADELSIDTSGIQDSTPLFSSGIIDSFSLVSLITFIEGTCGFKVSPMDVNLDNMDSIDRLLAYVSTSLDAREG